MQTLRKLITFSRVISKNQQLHQKLHRCYLYARHFNVQEAFYKDSKVIPFLLNRWRGAITNSYKVSGLCSSEKDGTSYDKISSEDKDKKAKTESEKKVLGLHEAKKYIEYTCKVCETRNNHMFSTKAYTKGIVIVTCAGCNSRHLIADNLGWFKGERRNIEEILAEKGEQVKYMASDKSSMEIIASEYLKIK